MIANKIYCYINGFLRWNISKTTSYIGGNKKFTRKVCTIDLRNKRKSNFARVKKDCSMTETRRFKSVAIYFQSILSFVLSREIMKIYDDITRKH